MGFEGDREALDQLIDCEVVEFGESHGFAGNPQPHTDPMQMTVRGVIDRDPYAR